MLFWQDFVSPFHLFMKANYVMQYVKMEDDISDSQISLESNANMRRSKNSGQQINFRFEIINSRIEKFEIIGKNINLLAKEIKY